MNFYLVYSLGVILALSVVVMDEAREHSKRSARVRKCYVYLTLWFDMYCASKALMWIMWKGIWEWIMSCYEQNDLPRSNPFLDQLFIATGTSRNICHRGRKNVYRSTPPMPWIWGFFSETTRGAGIRGRGWDCRKGRPLGGIVFYQSTRHPIDQVSEFEPSLFFSYAAKLR